MRITKFTHACVRLEHGGRVLVVDPGVWSEPYALRDADAVLVTHEHGDHVDVLRLRGLGVPVYAPQGADLRNLDAHRVVAGEEFTAAGFAVRAVGGRHAEVHGGLPDCVNLGYVVDGEVYHPGDSLHVPDVAVRTLFAPVHGSWLKTTEALDFVNAIKPERTFAIHEAQLDDRGLESVNGWFARETDGYRYLRPFEEA
jgi:L-ascorbate metabolism protein UlaG (beta-lactamase superfamily)